MDGISALQPAFCNRESAVLWKSDYREISSWYGELLVSGTGFPDFASGRRGKGILDYFGWCLAYIFVPGILICQFYMFIRGKGHRRKQRKRAVGVVTGILSVSLFMSGCGAAVEPEKRMYPMALGVDASEEGICLTYGMPDLSESTGQGKEEEDGGSRVLQISGADFTRIEKMYDQSQEKLLDMGHLQVLVMGRTLVEDGRWRMVLDYLKQEIFVGKIFMCLRRRTQGRS